MIELSVTEIKVQCEKPAGFLFYPFGGPDFLTAFEFFPQAESFVLMGAVFSLHVN